MQGLINILLLAFLIINLLLLYISFIPFSYAKSYIDALGPDGSVRFFTNDFYLLLVSRLRLFSLIFFIITVTIWHFRKFIDYHSVGVFNLYQISFDKFINDIHYYIITLYDNNIKELKLLLLICICGLSIRIYYLFTPIRIDEAGIFVYIVSKPLFVCISSYWAPGNHVFYTAMARNFISYFWRWRMGNAHTRIDCRDIYNSSYLFFI